MDAAGDVMEEAQTVESEASSDFDGTYKLWGEIKTGARSVVYHAEQQKLGKEVAIKVLRDRLPADPLLREDFNEELRKLSALDHANLVSICGFGIVGDAPYVAMELLEGENLAERLRQGLIEPELTEQLILAMLRALAHMHVRGVVHRNLTPSSVFLQRDGESGVKLKLIDYGLTLRPANQNADATQLGPGLRANPYMPPEQAAGDDVDARADVYSAAAVIREMTGIDLGRAAAGEVAAESSASVTQVITTPTPEFQAFLLRSLDVAKVERFRNADQMLTALLQLSSPWFERTQLEVVEELASVEDVEVMQDGTSEFPLIVEPEPEASPIPPALPRKPRKTSRKLIAAGAIVALGAGAWTLAQQLRPPPTQEEARLSNAAAAGSVAEAAAARVLATLAQEEAAKKAQTPEAAAAAGAAPTLGQATLPAAAVGPEQAPLPAAAPTLARTPLPAAAPGPERALQPAAAATAERTPLAAATRPADPAPLPAPAQPLAQPTAARDRGPLEPATPTRQAAPSEPLAPAPAAPPPLAALDNPNWPMREPPRSTTASPSLAQPAAVDEMAPATPEPPLQPPPGAMLATAARPHPDGSAAAGQAPPAGAAPPNTAPSPSALQPSAAGPRAQPPAPAGRVKSDDVGWPPPTEALAASSGARDWPPSAAKAQIENKPAHEAPSSPAEPQPPSIAPPPAAAKVNGSVRHVRTTPYDIRELLELARASDPPRGRPGDPWTGPLPKELETLRDAIAKGEPGTPQQIAVLRRFCRKNPDDAHGHLLLAGLYTNRGWSLDALDQYELAYRKDPTTRGAPEMITDTLRMVTEGVADVDAARFIARSYQREALPVLDHALRDRGLAPAASARLKKLRARIASGAR